MRNQSTPADFQFVTLLADQAWSMAEYLCDRQDPDGRWTRFRSFLAGLRRFGTTDELFRRHFGYGVDRLLRDWRPWALAQDAETTEPLSPQLRDALCDRVLPTATGQMTPLPKRITAVRSLGLCGSTLAVEGLNGLLRADDARLRAEALWSLSALSGRSAGERA
jgi:hypothetical protein